VISDAQEAADLAARLTSSLLAFGRQMPLHPVLSDIGQLVTATGDLLRRTLGETIEIRVATKGGCWAIVDGPQLQNSLLNLAINARDAMPEGGVLSIEVSEEELDEDYAAVNPEVRPGRYVLVRVSDTGSGMTPEVKERAFEPFFTTKPQGSGTGLGLSSVYGFVRQSGGHIALYSDQGQGTTIRIYLPAVMREPAGSTFNAAGASSTPKGQGERVLVVEDDDRVRRVTVARLKSLGYSVKEAVSARDALDLLEKHPNVDLLFTDMVMPGGMSGAELALEVRRRLPALPVLFTSGYAEPETIKDVAIENQQWLGKPYTTSDLAKRLREIFDRGQR
jgi:CheY-like chemotaxis protein